MLLTTGGYNAFLDLITVLLIFVFVIANTLFTTKYIANYQKVQSLGKNIEVFIRARKPEMLSNCVVCSNNEIFMIAFLRKFHYSRGASHIIGFPAYLLNAFGMNQKQRTGMSQTCCFYILGSNLHMHGTASLYKMKLFVGNLLFYP